MDLNNWKDFFDDRAKELEKACSDTTPWIFLCGSAMVDYLAKSVNGRDVKGDGYKQFIRDYLGSVRPGYCDFKYANGKQDLPEQMYHVLRCGIVHSFSLIPDSTAVNKGGRDRSIVLCHRAESNANGWHHLMNYSGPQKLDAALFVAEDFIADISKLIDLIFSRAVKDTTLTGNIVFWTQKHPPITGGF